MTATTYQDVTITRSEDGTTRLAGRMVVTGFVDVAFRAALPLLWIREAMGVSPAAHRAIWKEADGFGPGFDEGYDWSHVRDSSPAAVATMFALAQSFLSRETLAAKLGVPAADLENAD